jgi:hypothetical protein
MNLNLLKLENGVIFYNFKKATLLSEKKFSSLRDILAGTHLVNVVLF